MCRSLVDRLSSQYLGQIVQILINLEHFEVACRELERLLAAARTGNSAGPNVVLSATEAFQGHKKTAEKRIFELVNSKIDDLVEIAQYDWYVQNGCSAPAHADCWIFSNPAFFGRTARAVQKEPSNYIQTLTQYLSNIMTTVLLGLPAEIKELLYFNALSYAATKILVRAFSGVCSGFLLGPTVPSSFPRSPKNQSLWCCNACERRPIPFRLCGHPRQSNSSGES